VKWRSNLLLLILIGEISSSEVMASEGKFSVLIEICTDEDLSEFLLREMSNLLKILHKKRKLFAFEVFKP
jgi:hypothetical protein